MDTDEHRLNQITEKIIGCAFRVANELGCGFLEKVYENAMAHELRKVGLKVSQQHPITILYDGVVVGDYFADLVVEEFVLVELKAVKDLDEIHQAQCINYLKATHFPVCLLFNFGKNRIRIKRFRGGPSVPVEF
jgi:GxxExxY protein